MVACTPHSGFGTIRIERPAIVRIVDLSSCRVTTAKPQRPTNAVTVVYTRQGKTGTESIEYRGRIVLTVNESFARAPAGMPGPIVPEGVSPDRKWILYAIDPQGSASLAADGLTLRAVSVATGRSRLVASGLLYDDYRAWCGNRLVMTAGGDRISTHNKWLIATGPPDWRTRVVFKDPRVAFGSLACDGNGIVVQSAPASGVNDTVHPHWSIWRVGLDGSRTRLTRPGVASDESPRVAGSVVYFVRRGWLYALHHGRLLKLPPTDGYYGHTAWPYTVTR